MQKESLSTAQIGRAFVPVLFSNISQLQGSPQPPSIADDIHYSSAVSAAQFHCGSCRQAEWA